MRRNVALVAGGSLLAGSIGILLYRKFSQPSLPPPADLKLPYGYVPGWYSKAPDPKGYYVGLTDFTEQNFGGGWWLRDARGIRDVNFDPETAAHVGMTASLVFTYGDKGELKVFNVKIQQISGDDFIGSWATKPPANSGVQMPEFRSAHIFALHA